MRRFGRGWGRRDKVARAGPHAGFSAVDVTIAVVVITLLAAISAKPLVGLVQRIKAKNAGEGLKHYLMLARSRAIANPSRHCGVVFKVHAANSKLNDSVISFYDLPANNTYDAGIDSIYVKPYVVKKSDSLFLSIANPFPKEIVFRGDGSANSSLQVQVRLKHIKSTLDVLASTGRVKVVMQ